MRLLIFSLIFLSSCQSPQFLSDWFNRWKDSSLTYLASQSTRDSLSEEERKELLYLFGDLLNAKNCSQVQSYIENNPVVVFFETELDLPKGFLFDVFVNNYSYEAALIQLDRSRSEQAAFSIVSVWKTKISLKDIEYIINKVSKCYPDEYL